MAKKRYSSEQIITHLRHGRPRTATSLTTAKAPKKSRLAQGIG
jgi:hypothetical protein